MASHLVTLTFDAGDALRLATFWAGVLRWERTAGGRGTVLVPPDDSGLPIGFSPTRDQPSGQNRMHLDLTSTSLEDQQETVARSLSLGARQLDVGQRPEEGHVVLADPEGNPFCVVGPGNSFLADCGFLGALSCDGTQQVGYFWSEALGWPLVWDQDDATAIRAPHGGPKLSWGGPPVAAKTGKDRLHLDLAPSDGSDHEAEVQRLLSLGATRVDLGHGDVDRDVLADPDGNEFCLLRR